MKRALFLMGSWYTPVWSSWIVLKMCYAEIHLWLLFAWFPHLSLYINNRPKMFLWIKYWANFHDSDLFLISEWPLNRVHTVTLQMKREREFVRWHAAVCCFTNTMWVFSFLCSEHEIHLWLLVMYQGRCLGPGPCGVCGEGHVPERLGVSGSGSCRGVIPLTWAPLARVLLIYWATAFQPLPPPQTHLEKQWRPRPKSLYGVMIKALKRSKRITSTLILTFCFVWPLSLLERGVAFGRFAECFHVLNYR